MLYLDAQIASHFLIHLNSCRYYSEKSLLFLLFQLRLVSWINMVIKPKSIHLFFIVGNLLDSHKSSCVNMSKSVIVCFLLWNLSVFSFSSFTADRTCLFDVIRDCVQIFFLGPFTDGTSFKVSVLFYLKESASRLGFYV